jgi:hypothetical protein
MKVATVGAVVFLSVYSVAGIVFGGDCQPIRAESGGRRPALGRVGRQRHRLRSALVGMQNVDC